jgi:hypothetical protein
LQEARRLGEEGRGQAVAILERVVRRNPRSVEAWRELTVALFEPYSSARCRAALGEWEALCPDDPQLDRVKAGLAFADTDFEEALAHAQRALERAPDDFTMRWARAQCERYLRRPTWPLRMEEARATDPEAFLREMRREEALEKYAPMEAQVAFERILRIGSLADEGETVRARRLAQLSQGQFPSEHPCGQLLARMVDLLEAAERRGVRAPRARRSPVRRIDRRRAGP